MTDAELIKKWKKEKSMAAYRTLKQRNKNMVYQAVHRYKAANIPQSSLEMEAWKLFDDAVDNFDPNAGAQFSTYLNFQLRKLDRHTKKYQNIARIPEALASKIGDYDREKTRLSQQLKRQPTHREMADVMNMPVKHVVQLHNSRRSDLYEGKFEGQDVERQSQHLDWVLKEVRDELSDQERLVYDHLIGYKKRKITNKKVLAKKLNMSPGRISQITRNIALKVGPHIKSHL